jgi:transposase-like protein
MPPFTTDPVCPKCGGPSDFVEKNTFTGQEIREYRCESCGHLFAEYGGTALWQVLHDANEAAAEAARLRARKPWWKFWKR